MDTQSKSSKKTLLQVPFKSPYLPDNPKIMGVQEGYDLWSEFYDEEANVLILLEQRHLYPQLKSRNYQAILDCGCGTGRLAIWLREHFPLSTISGADFSEGMLNKAREKGKEKAITWHNADLNRHFPFEDNQFDLIVSSLVIEHIKAMETFFAGIKRVASPGSDIFITGLHPTMHLLGISARFKNREKTADIHPESRCHSLSDIYNAAVEAGLKVTRIEEFHVDQQLINECPKAERYAGMPLLFIMRMKTA